MLQQTITPIRILLIYPLLTLLVIWLRSLLIHQCMTSVLTSSVILELVGLGERMNHKPNELSGGQQQRVAIARALINDPEIILADEPTGNLDSHSGQQIMEMLSNLHKEQKKTIILVTHDTDLIYFSERTVHIKDGMIDKIRLNGKK